MNWDIERMGIKVENITKESTFQDEIESMVARDNSTRRKLQGELTVYSVLGNCRVSNTDFPG